jgi:hypothetical protein
MIALSLTVFLSIAHAGSILNRQVFQGMRHDYGFHQGRPVQFYSPWLTVTPVAKLDQSVATSEYPPTLWMDAQTHGFLPHAYAGAGTSQE